MALSRQVRRAVFKRAGRCCEYCRVGEGREPVLFQVDHIIAKKHGGTDYIDNLCVSCADCNRYKGDNVAAIDPLTNDATRLFNPRQQNWQDHFFINPDASLSGNTPEGRATALVLRMNESLRIEQRFDERLLGNYPCQTDR